ncbi:MAG: restriction endonuclease subunit R, partial [Candidatus Pelagibacter sp.]|nr:restriction endonuclease subunit R [Candidatus Pelagibacter sp.]
KKKINPLLIIQLPDVKTEQEKRLSSDVVKILREKFKITVENEKLAIWLSGLKKNCKNIEHNTHKSEVIIIKNAIALGWDCPRASVLALFRDWKSFTFSIQTVGRIMRMPEPEFGHYSKEILNNAFIYTNLETVNIEEEIGKNYITIFTSGN